MCQIYSGWAFVTGEYVRIEMNWKSSETFPGLGLMRVIRAPEGASCKKAVVSLFGVFDGHSGATLRCSSICSKQTISAFWFLTHLLPLHPFTSFYLIPFLTDSLQNSLRDWFWSSMCWLRGIVQWLCGHKSGSNCVRHRLWFATCRTQRLAAPRGTRKNTTFQIFQFATHLQWGLLLRSFKYFWRINIHRLSQTLAHQLN